MILKNLLLLIFFVELAYSNDCFASIKKLSPNDKCLCSRHSLKRTKAQPVQNTQEFFNAVKYIECNGTEFSCGDTMSWVSEVFLGLQSQYQESKYDDGLYGEIAGYKLNIGNQLVEFFEKGRLINDSLIYQLRHSGTEDHVWTIEQLVNQTGYRIYQSYNDAFSLKAWLSDDPKALTNLFKSGDILVNQKTKNLVNAYIIQLTNGLNNITTLDLASNIPAYILPYARYVRDYNETIAINNFKRAWQNYGQGQIITWSNLKTYISILANLTSYFNTYDNTATLFDENIFNNWINIHAAPNLVHFPNLPNNAIASLIFKNRVYRFETKVSILTQPKNCAYNAQIVSAQKPFLCSILPFLC